MKLTASPLLRLAGSGSLLLIAMGAIAPSPTTRLGPWGAVAQAQTEHPFEGHSIVYVQSGDRWREAFVNSVSGRLSQGQAVWSYGIKYLDPEGGIEQNVSPSRMATIADAQAQGLTDNVYNLSSAAGSDQMLAAHNEARQAVGVDDLTWSTELAGLAQDWADQLVTQSGLRHRPADERDGGRIGENLASSSATVSGGAMSHPRRAAWQWVSERADYDYDSNSCTPGKMCGHYTQVVWADTDQVGCAVARNESETREVWVCNYTPAGNFVGQRPY